MKPFAQAVVTITQGLRDIKDINGYNSSRNLETLHFILLTVSSAAAKVTFVSLPRAFREQQARKCRQTSWPHYEHAHTHTHN